MVARDSAGGGRHTRGMVEVGDRMLIPCDGGPSISRLERFPPAFEIPTDDGTYVLVDDGPPEQWRYEYVPRRL